MILIKFHSLSMFYWLIVNWFIDAVQTQCSVLARALISSPIYLFTFISSWYLQNQARPLPYWTACFCMTKHIHTHTHCSILLSPSSFWQNICNIEYTKTKTPQDSNTNSSNYHTVATYQGDTIRSVKGNMNQRWQLIWINIPNNKLESNQKTLCASGTTRRDSPL